MKVPSKLSWAIRSILRAREVIKDKTCYLVGKEAEIELWTQPWHTDGVLEQLISKSVTDYSLSSMKCLDEIHSKEGWNPIINKPSLNQEISILQRSLFQEEDENRAIWKPNIDGYFSVKSAWNSIRQQNVVVPWASSVWFPGHVPRQALITWKVLHMKLLTRDHPIFCNRVMDDRCPLCNSEKETINHLFFRCGFSAWVWRSILWRYGSRRKLKKTIQDEEEWLRIHCRSLKVPLP
ncbi:uncharacterized protein LOC143888963 [Tasmannia lanceolata]|uniref:uncharacterized protein LOC143888963 n=1 Tax=Tasmannia lanceolata TaxID=3420 RepID=UPI004062BB5B